ncbi:MAG: class I SAM-dependent methyltransferase [Phycisphaeraceae bacterium]|nr:MAG: class I SAM-dependent methyltransferase [Phycisphaeraceae bacterium]
MIFCDCENTWRASMRITKHSESATPEQIEELLAPTAPHDDLPFEQLIDLYNFRQTSSWMRLFVRLLRKECRALPRPRKVLDIGCGRGIAQSKVFLSAIRAEVDELWGIEPDPNMTGDPKMFDQFQNATMEGAQLPENYFDLAFSFMVVEHIADPERYMRAVARVLRPGGVHFFITVNGLHYFARTASILHMLKLDEIVLRALRGKQVDEYHYPIQYKCNKPKDVRHFATVAGFENTQIVFVEEDGPKPYFPLLLRPIWWVFMAKRHLIRTPKSLSTIYVRMEKGGARASSVRR